MKLLTVRFMWLYTYFVPRRKINSNMPLLNVKYLFKKFDRQFGREGLSIQQLCGRETRESILWNGTVFCKERIIVGKLRRRINYIILVEENWQHAVAFLLWEQRKRMGSFIKCGFEGRVSYSLRSGVVGWRSYAKNNCGPTSKMEHVSRYVVKSFDFIAAT